MKRTAKTSSTKKKSSKGPKLSKSSVRKHKKQVAEKSQARSFLKKGYFISFEGGEGAGKTTQIAQLVKSLEAKGYRVVVSREPGGSRRANYIRSLILNKKIKGLEPLAELFLYEASRAQHVADIIKPALKRGYIVVCDRYTDSSIVYQGAARGVDEKTVQQLNRLATGGLRPDLTFILDLNPKIGLARVGSRGVMDHMEQENLSFHQKVRKGFHKLAGENKRRCHIVDASMSRSQIAEQIIEILRRKKLL